jgi:hypothetical protein
MRNVVSALSLVLLAACGQPAAPAPETAPPAVETTPAPVEALSTGEMGAMSNTAMSLTGSLTVTPTALNFENGFAAQTQTLALVDATTPIAAGGESFAATAPGPTSLRVEIRRITAPAPAQLCGGSPAATYVALASDEPITALTLIVFSGADQPGPQAHDSAVCATFMYGVD